MRWCSAILITAVALSCLATAINGKVSQDLLVPFNDLLPPLVNAEENADTAVKQAIISSMTSRTTQLSTTSTSILFKPTKKSYYEQQTQHIKELHLIDEDTFVPHDYKEQREHLQHLHEPKEEQEHQLLLQRLQQEKLQHKQEPHTLQVPQGQSGIQHKKVQTMQSTFEKQQEVEKKKHLVKPSSHKYSPEGQEIQQKIVTLKQQILLPPTPTQEVLLPPLDGSTEPQEEKQNVNQQQQQNQQLQQSRQAQQQQREQQLKQQPQFHPQPKEPEQFQKQPVVKIIRMQPINSPKHETLGHQQLSRQQSSQQHIFKKQHHLRQQHHQSLQSQPLNLEQLHNYLDYFQHTTHRPPKGQLPTLTPFPRHLRS